MSFENKNMNENINEGHVSLTPEEEARIREKAIMLGQDPDAAVAAAKAGPQVGKEVAELAEKLAQGIKELTPEEKAKILGEGPESATEEDIDEMLDKVGK